MAETPPIERAFFRDGEDGVPVFFPWGLTHRGYRVPGESDRARAARAAKLLMGSVVGIGVWTAHTLQPVLEGEGPASAVLSAIAAPGAVLAGALLLYAAWASRFVEGLQESDLQLSREERLQEAAQLAKPWQVAGIGLFLAAGSASVCWLQPSAWWLGAAGIGLGLGLVGWSVLLRRAAAQPPRH